MIRATAIAIAASVAAAPAAAAAKTYRFHSDFTLGRVIKRDYLHSQVRFSGTIVDGAGVPAAYIPVDVISSPSLAGGPGTTVAVGETDASGRYSLVAPIGPPRVLYVRAGGNVTSTVRELVAPSLWMRAVPRGGGRVAVFGRIWMAPGSPAPPIIMKDLAPGGWQTFAWTGVRPGGGFHLVYRGSKAVRGTFSFRATTPPINSIWGVWRSGVSRPVAVTVH